MEKDFRTIIWLNLEKDTKNINRIAKREIKVGELVLISDENSQRHRWRVAVVEELISSEDGYVNYVLLM